MFIGLCSSTVRPVFPMFVLQQVTTGKRQNLSRTTPSTKRFHLRLGPWKGFEALSCLLSWFNPPRLHLHSLEAYTKWYSKTLILIRIARKRYPKERVRQRFCGTFSCELSGAICLKTPVFLASALELFRRFFRAVRAIFWLWGSFFGP